MDQFEKSGELQDKIRGALFGGAICGYNRIKEKWKEKLELKDIILEMADDLFYGCQMNGHSENIDPEWESKYIFMRRYPHES